MRLFFVCCLYLQSNPVAIVVCPNTTGHHRFVRNHGRGVFKDCDYVLDKLISKNYDVRKNRPYEFKD